MKKVCYLLLATILTTTCAPMGIANAKSLDKTMVINDDRVSIDVLNTKDILVTNHTKNMISKITLNTDENYFVINGEKIKVNIKTTIENVNPDVNMSKNQIIEVIENMEGNDASKKSRMSRSVGLDPADVIPYDASSTYIATYKNSFDTTVPGGRVDNIAYYIAVVAMGISACSKFLVNHNYTKSKLAEAFAESILAVVGAASLTIATISKIGVEGHFSRELYRTDSTYDFPNGKLYGYRYQNHAVDFILKAAEIGSWNVYHSFDEVENWWTGQRPY